MSIYLPQQSICSTIHSVEDNDGNDIRTYHIWLRNSAPVSSTNNINISSQIYKGIIRSQWSYVHSVPAEPAVSVGPCSCDRTLCKTATMHIWSCTYACMYVHSTFLAALIFMMLLWYNQVSLIDTWGVVCSHVYHIIADNTDGT